MFPLFSAAAQVGDSGVLNRHKDTPVTQYTVSGGVYCKFYVRYFVVLYDF